MIKKYAKKTSFLKKQLIYRLNHSPEKKYHPRCGQRQRGIWVGKPLSERRPHRLRPHSGSAPSLVFPGMSHFRAPRASPQLSGKLAGWQPDQSVNQPRGQPGPAGGGHGVRGAGATLGMATQPPGWLEPGVQDYRLVEGENVKNRINNFLRSENSFFFVQLPF